MAFRRRLLRLFLITALAFTLVWLRMLQLQVLDRDTWVQAAKAKRQRELDLPAPRGRIVDAKGRVLAEDRPIYQLAVVGWDWAHRARVRCSACSAIHFHAPGEKPRRSCPCGDDSAILEPLPPPDPAPLETLLGLESGELARRAQARLEAVDALVASLEERLGEESHAEFLVHDRILQYRRDLLHRPFLIVPRIPWEAVRLVELDTEGTYRGFRVRTDLRRHYPEGGPASQLLGYVSVIQDETELARYRARYGEHVTLDTRVGRDGLESSLEALLLGRKGWERQERDADGAFTITVDGRPPQRGMEVRLALTAESCLEAEAVLKEHGKAGGYFPRAAPSGGFFAMDADTGAILAWGEMPRLEIEKDLEHLFDDAQAEAVFDPDIGQWVLPEGAEVPEGETQQSWLQGLSKPAPVHFSRVSQIAVEPGSTFKVFIGLGMLEGLRHMAPGTLLPHEDWFPCQGRSSKSPKCHTHRPVGFEGSIEVSCNPYFAYSVRDRPRYWEVWRRTIPVLLQDLGFGQTTGVDVYGESAGTFLRPYVDFDPMQAAQVAVARVRERRGLPPGRVTIRVHGRVPPLVAGRGADRLVDLLDRLLDAALDVAGTGRVVLNVTPLEGDPLRRSIPLRFEAYAQPDPEGPPPKAPNLAQLSQVANAMAGGLEAEAKAPGVYTFGVTLKYVEAVGRKPGDPPVILQDDGRNVAIGQGPVAVTPLQMVRAVAVIANGGRLVTPYVGAAIDGVPQHAPSRPLPIHPDDLARIRAGMRAAVYGPQGTASGGGWQRVPATVYGKTGTAQVGKWWKVDQPVDQGPWHHWFVGFAEAPGMRTIAFACVLHARTESAASRTAVHAASDFLAWWYREGPDVR